MLSTTAISAENHSEKGEEEQCSSLKPVTILALVYNKGHLGAAIIHSDRSDVIYLMQTQPELPEYPTAEDCTWQHWSMVVIHCSSINTRTPRYRDYSG